MSFCSGSKEWKVRWSLTATTVLVITAFWGLFVLDGADTVRGTVLYVGKGSTYASLEDALQAAEAGDMIIVGPGQYNGSLTVGTDRLTITGNSSVQTIIRGQNGLPSLDIKSDDVIVSWLRIEEGAIISSSVNLTLSNLTILCSTDPAVDLTYTRNCTISDTTFLDTNGVAVRSFKAANTTLVRVSSLSGTLLHSEDSNRTVITDCIFAQSDTGLMVLSSWDVRVDLIDRMEIGGGPAHFQDTVDITFGGGSLVQNAVGQFPILFEGCTNITMHDLALSQMYSMVEGMTFADCNMVKVDNLSFFAGSSRHAMSLTQTDHVEILESVFAADGTHSGHIFVRGTVKDMSISKCTFTVKGDDSNAVDIGQECKVNVFDSLFHVESKRSSAITVRGNGCTFSDNTYYVSEDKATGVIVNGTGPELTRETMFISGAFSKGIGSMGSTGLHLLSSRLRVTGSSAVGIALELAGVCTINATIVNNTQDGGPCLKTLGGTLYLLDTELNTRSASPAAFLERSDAYIMGSWFHGNERGLDLMDCGNVQISGSTFNALKPLSTNHSDEVLIYGSDLFDLFLPVDGIRAYTGSKAYLYDSHFEGIYCDPTSEVHVANSITVRTLTRDLKALPGVDIRAISDGNTIYQTGHFSQWGQPRTDSEGLITPLSMTYAKYIRSDSPVHPQNTVEAYLEGTAPEPWSMTYPINASEVRTVDLVSPDIDYPRVPQDLTVVPVGTREALFLNWELNQDDTIEYWIYMLDSRTGTMGLMAKVGGGMASYTTDDLGERFDATFEVRAFDGTYLSAPSSRASATTVDLTPPAAPTGLTVGAITDTSVQISWDHQGSDDLALFEVLVNNTSTSASFHVAETARPEVRTFTLKGLYWNTLYHLRVRAVDLTLNGSPTPETLQVRTLYPPLLVTVRVRFSDDGPNAGEAAESSGVTLHTSAGESSGPFLTDVSGECTMTGLVPEMDYYLIADPPEGTEGEEGIRAGYLEARSATFSLLPGGQPLEMELVLPYQGAIIIGLIKVKVEFGGGPRSGPVHQAVVSLLEPDGMVLRTVIASSEGTVTFSIQDLPFTGKVRARPPEDLAGDPATDENGYLETLSETLELTREDPLPDEVILSLPYYEGTAPPRYLYILRRMPTGSSVNLDTPLSVTFDQPVDRTSVGTSLNVVPPLTEPRIEWSMDGRTLTVHHAGLTARTSYQVSIGTGAVSMNGTSFPPGYTDNAWSFRTTDEPAEEEGDRPGTFLILLIAIVVAALIIGAAIWVFTIRNRDMEDGERGSLEDSLLGPEGVPPKEYPSDLVDGMVTGMPRDSSVLEE